MLAWSWPSKFYPPVTCVLCDKTKNHTADILIPNETGITLVTIIIITIIIEECGGLYHGGWMATTEPGSM